MQEHRVTFERGATVFLDPNALSLFDEQHSEEEERWITLGLDQTGALLVISHTYREEAENSARVRLISARKATKTVPDDLYEQFIRKLKLYWRIPLEIAVFVSAWILAYQCVVLKRELLNRLESFSTGTPVETIIARQTASSGMYAFGEGLELIFLVTLLYLLCPVFFNLVGRLFKR